MKLISKKRANLYAQLRKNGASRRDADDITEYYMHKKKKKKKPTPFGIRMPRF